jgi:hypothetical protein
MALPRCPHPRYPRRDARIRSARSEVRGMAWASAAAASGACVAASWRSRQQLSGFLSSIPEIVARGYLASQCPVSLSSIPETDARSAARGEGKRGRYTNVKPYQGSPPRIGKKGREGDGVPDGGHWIGGPQVLLPATALALTVVARRAPPLGWSSDGAFLAFLPLPERREFCFF